MAKHVGFFTDLTEMPEDGPFVVGWLGDSPRIEHVQRPDGSGCPQVLSGRLYRYIERHCIPRGDEGADWLNRLWHAGEFEWVDGRILPKEPEDYQPADLDQYVSFGDIARGRCGVQCQYASRLIGKLGTGLRWWSMGSSYHDILIHRDDVDECVRRWRHYYVSNGIRSYDD